MAWRPAGPLAVSHAARYRMQGEKRKCEEKKRKQRTPRTTQAVLHSIEDCVVRDLWTSFAIDALFLCPKNFRLIVCKKIDYIAKLL